MFDGFSFSYSHFSSLKQLSGFKSYGAFSLQLSFTICQHQQLTPWLVMANRALQHPQTQHLQGHTATGWGSQKRHSQVDHPPWEPRGGKLTTAQNSLSGAQHWEPHCSDGCVGTTEGQNELQNDHSKRPRNKMLLKENIFSSGFAYCYFLLTFTDCSPPFPQVAFWSKLPNENLVVEPVPFTKCLWKSLPSCTSKQRATTIKAIYKTTQCAASTTK